MVDSSISYEKNVFLFGLNSNSNEDKAIICFDLQTEQFKKIEPPKNIQICNYMSASFYKKEFIILTGGIDSQYKKISNSTIMYNFISNTFEEYPKFNLMRYTHSSIIHKNKLFIIGGRTSGNDFESLLNHCECLDLETKQWKIIAPMQKKRSTSGCFIYKDQIWVVGGYSGQSKRTRIIEKFNEEKNFWERVNFKLNRGVEISFIVSPNQDEFVILGGNIQTGPTNTCHCINIKQKTVRSKDWLINQRVLHKGIDCLNQNTIYCLGGDNQNTIEKANVKGEEWHWSILQTNINKLINFDLIKSFCCSQNSLQIENGDEPEIQEFQDFQLDEFQENQLEPEQDKRYLFFGNDEDPFIIDIQSNKQKIQCLPVPINLRLMAYQGGVRINQDCYFLAGGITFGLDSIFKKTYIYNLKTKKAKSLAKMNYERYAFSIAYIYPFIYIIGGRRYQTDDVAILSVCEKYDIRSNKFQQICSLNERKCSTSIIIIKQKIYIFGGYQGEGVRSNKIETYDEQNDKWDILNFKLNANLEGFAVFLDQSKSELYILGGKNTQGDSRQVKVLDIGQGLDKSYYKPEKQGQLDVGRCLHKIFQLDAESLVIMGGYNDIELGFCCVYDFKLKQTLHTKNEKFLKDLNNVINLQAGDVELKTYCLI